MTGCQGHSSTIGDSCSRSGRRARCVHGELLGARLQVRQAAVGKIIEAGRGL